MLLAVRNDFANQVGSAFGNLVAILCKSSGSLPRGTTACNCEACHPHVCQLSARDRLEPPPVGVENLDSSRRT